jgi:hypothetical protein
MLLRCVRDEADKPRRRAISSYTELRCCCTCCSWVSARSSDESRSRRSLGLCIAKRCPCGEVVVTTMSDHAALASTFPPSTTMTSAPEPSAPTRVPLVGAYLPPLGHPRDASRHWFCHGLMGTRGKKSRRTRPQAATCQVRRAEAFHHPAPGPKPRQGTARRRTRGCGEPGLVWRSVHATGCRAGADAQLRSIGCHAYFCMLVGAVGAGLVVRAPRRAR